MEVVVLDEASPAQPVGVEEVAEPIEGKVQEGESSAQPPPSESFHRPGKGPTYVLPSSRGGESGLRGAAVGGELEVRATEGLTADWAETEGGLVLRWSRPGGGSTGRPGRLNGVCSSGRSALLAEVTRLVGIRGSVQAGGQRATAATVEGAGQGVGSRG
ncbi:uncharacterized protein A4U43_C04F27040 [Asparagus officinalis]|uniref:Uncharacterized protein n=1 Tax=Asparagus officinalis TaxID=4686 RepID=A0A5P1F3Z6_ASPOF|nr:uncharacterized protein A4U43_C04F27040 [Asparagus officinalis]